MAKTDSELKLYTGFWRPWFIDLPEREKEKPTTNKPHKKEKS